MTEMYTSRQRPGSKPTESRAIIAVIANLMTIDTPLLPLATLMVYSLRLSQRSRNISTAMGGLHIVYDEKGNEISRIKTKKI